MMVSVYRVPSPDEKREELSLTWAAQSIPNQPDNLFCIITEEQKIIATEIRFTWVPPSKIKPHQLTVI